jgi:superfamily II DNA or RNA helicase
MLPSLARRDDIVELTQGYGQVIVDECHHLAAAAYDHSVKRIGAQFWLGLAATPARRDELGEIVNWQLGPVRHTMTQEDQGTLAAVWGERRTPATPIRPRNRIPLRRPRSFVAGCARRRAPDAPALDTLFLAGPISYDGLLVQCVGRVIRTAPGKFTAEVHDYHDPATPIIAVSLQRRMPGYRTLGFDRT